MEVKKFMKNLIKKYYELDDEVKDDLELLYTYQTLISLFDEYDVKIKTIGEMEKLMHIIQKCMVVTDFSPDFIITNIFELLDLQDVSIEDLYDLEVDDLLEILFTFDEDNENEDVDNEENCQYEEIPNDEDNKQEVILEFTYEGYYCIFCQNRDKYLVIITKGEYSGVIVLDSINEIFDGTFERKLAELKLHE